MEGQVDMVSVVQMRQLDLNDIFLAQKFQLYI